MNKRSILTGTLAALIGASSYFGSPACAQEAKTQEAKPATEERYDTPETNPLIKALKDYSEGKAKPYINHKMETELNQYEQKQKLELTPDELKECESKTITSGQSGLGLIFAGIAFKARNNNLDEALERKLQGLPYNKQLRKAAIYNSLIKSYDSLAKRAKVTTGN